MRRGEIRWYRFSHPDKRRPVVILTRDSIIPHLGEVTVAPLTTRIRNIPSEVALSRDDGPPRECAVNCDHLQTVPRSRLGAPIGSLSADKIRQLSRAIRFALAL